jgi:DNA-binding NarL/FixJ family response regulator
VRLLLVDDDEAQRHGIRRAVELKTTFEVVGEATEPGAAITLVDELDVQVMVIAVGRVTPEVTEAIATIKENQPGVYVLALSSSGDPSTASALLSAGASGFLLEAPPEGQFLSPLEAAASGHRMPPMEPLRLG